MAAGLSEQLEAIKTVVDAIKLRTDNIGSIAVVVTTPVGTSGDMLIYAGADSGTISLSATGYTGVNIDGKTGKLRLIHVDDWLGDSDAVEAAVEADVSISQSGTTLTMTSSLTAAQTAGLDTVPGENMYNYRYQVTVIPSGETAERVICGAGVAKNTGRCTVAKRITA